jgi:osmotically-inducible protein OsmY
MKNNKKAILVALGVTLSALTLAGCIGVAAVGAGAAVLGMEDRRTGGTIIEDERIELVISNRIGERFGDKVHVNVTSFNRSVLLTGEVPDEGVKAELERIAAAQSNVRGVTNDLQVGPNASYGSRATDASVTGRVKARFLDANKFSPVHVKVVTENGVVYLLGLVNESEANDAVEVARTTSGVRKVVKVFDYCKPNETACAPRAGKADAKAEPAKK